MKSTVIIEILVVVLYILAILSYIVPVIWHYIYVQKHNDLDQEIVAAGYKMIRTNMWHSFIPLWNIISLVFWKMTHPGGYTGKDLYIAAKTELFGNSIKKLTSSYFLYGDFLYHNAFFFSFSSGFFAFFVIVSILKKDLLPSFLLWEKGIYVD